MLLLIDAGNTRVKWALAPRSAAGNAGELGKWIASGSIDHAHVSDMADDWRAANVNRVIVSNVAGQAVHDELERTLTRVLGLRPVPLEWFASAPVLAGMRNAYRNPHQLGCDRFAAAIGARALYPGQALIVATCGTATTIDAVTADGVFLGGMILPGLGLMMQSLARNTAQLPEVKEGHAIVTAFADNTDSAIVSGCMAAQAGAIERAVAAHGGTAAGVRCVLSGGAAGHIAPHLALPVTCVDNLVLIGLQAVAAAESTAM